MNVNFSRLKTSILSPRVTTVQRGSSLNLQCVVQEHEKSPEKITWVINGTRLDFQVSLFTQNRQKSWKKTVFLRSSSTQMLLFSILHDHYKSIWITNFEVRMNFIVVTQICCLLCTGSLTQAAMMMVRYGTTLPLWRHWV